MSELLTGQQLVVRMQYDDDINVCKGDLDDVLTSVTQSLKGKSLPDYDVTLGARLNNAATTNGSTEGVDSIAMSNGHSPPSNGLQALTSSPSDNYSYYAKTSVRSGDQGCQPGVKQQSTIVVEIFVNEKIQPSDKTKQKKIIGSVTDAIQDIIVKKQTNSQKPRICVLNFTSSS